MMCCLRSFEIVVALKVSFYKSKLGGVVVDCHALRILVACLNCNLMEVPFTFLGISVGANPRKQETWKPLIDKIKAALSR